MCVTGCSYTKALHTSLFCLEIPTSYHRYSSFPSALASSLGPTYVRMSLNHSGSMSPYVNSGNEFEDDPHAKRHKSLLSGSVRSIITLMKIYKVLKVQSPDGESLPLRTDQSTWWFSRACALGRFLDFAALNDYKC